MKNGAKFLRADMHIHSFGDFGSYDVTDTSMTPEAIVDTAIEKGLGIISLTDHNEIFNSRTAIKYSEGKNILVIPGIEVSTTQGHLLLYFPSFDNLRAFHGKLTIAKNKKTCTNGIVQCLEFANQENGIGILAHIDVAAGFEQTIGRFNPVMEEIFKQPNLLGLEISDKANTSFYTDRDNNTDRIRLINLYRTSCNYDIDHDIAKLLSSDAHTLDKLGINADGGNKLTRIKLDELTFHSFKIALISNESRVRLEDFIPEQRPIIKSISIEGGLLDKVHVDLSNNLTCIIGGRGAGKSTLLEAIRESSGNRSLAKVVDSDVWPQTISLEYEDEAGQVLNFRREKNSQTLNTTDPINGISKIDIESYGQGDTAATLQHCDIDPMILIRFLDDFLDLDDFKALDKELVEKLRANQSQAKKLRIEVSVLDQIKKALTNEQRKLQSLEKEKAGELVKYQSALLRERQLRSTLIKDLNALVDTYRQLFNKKDVFQTIEHLSDADIIVGKDYFNNVKKLVSEFSNIVAEKSGELDVALNLKIRELKNELEKWQGEEASIQAKIDEKKALLEAQGIPFDLGKINQISKDIIDYTNKINLLEGYQKTLKDLESERKELLNERTEAKNRIYYLRSEFAKSLNENLKNTIDGLYITVKYQQGTFSNEFEALLKSTMEWRTSQVPKASLIASSLSPLQFVDICRKNNQPALKALKDNYGSPFLSSEDAQSVIVKINKDYCYEEFESLGYEDRASIYVTKVIPDEQDSSKQKHISKQISELSLGQQQSVLLSILLLSKSNKPLIIDQPEDNLDSEFIFKTIVKNLRKIKEIRQVIIVTHNPNIAVLGDAELIVPLKSTNIKSFVQGLGSIDREETRGKCCEILEGGRTAFERRKVIYGI